jgi:hypothetical protein
MTGINTVAEDKASVRAGPRRDTDQRPIRLSQLGEATSQRVDSSLRRTGQILNTKSHRPPLALRLPTRPPYPSMSVLWMRARFLC